MSRTRCITCERLNSSSSTSKLCFRPAGHTLSDPGLLRLPAPTVGTGVNPSVVLTVMRRTLTPALNMIPRVVNLFSVADDATSCQGIEPRESFLISFCLKTAMALSNCAQAPSISHSPSSRSSTSRNLLCPDLSAEKNRSASSTTTRRTLSMASRHFLLVKSSSSKSIRCCGVATKIVPVGTELSTSRRRYRTESAFFSPTRDRIRPHICT
mmetsp:Transcript_58304/g.138959  ORF Transcript_58304/g.138959 Transcript_58304/m.138959 type:complete len:211 (-) Transcript_58304:660-1292(-)